ncbi:MAG: hypothetical protein PVS3B3_20620 [Ktedonobacteraceae bacterium]
MMLDPVYTGMTDTHHKIKLFHHTDYYNEDTGSYLAYAGCPNSLPACANPHITREACSSENKNK